MYKMIASLLAVCLLEVNDVHHKPKHDNYMFRRYVCSVDNFKSEPDTCGKLKELFESSESPQLPWEIEMKLLEIYSWCCEEA